MMWLYRWRLRRLYTLYFQSVETHSKRIDMLNATIQLEQSTIAAKIQKLKSKTNSTR